MVFNSLTFFLFFPVVAGSYFLVPQKVRWVHLLAASYFFYAFWEPKYLLLLLASTFVTYACSILQTHSSSIHLRRWLLISNLILILGCLFGFKYFNTAVSYGLPFLKYTAQPNFFGDFVLPLGISFYTFRLASYAIDVFRGSILPERHIGIFALYVSFFPSLLAGPIDRASVLIPQFHQEQTANLERMSSGIKRMMWGLFKKVVIADQLAIYVDAIFNNVHYHTGPSFVVASLFYAFQIYCDFSGYSDMALGSAKILGLNLAENFNLPYFATSIRDFWQRWHITLSTWFRDYVYFPLGGNKKGISRTYANLLITMTLCGFWHGANLTFVLWGAMHGLALGLSRTTEPFSDRFAHGLNIPARLWKSIKIIKTFALVTLLWIPFRANSLSDAAYILRTLHTGWPHFFIDAASLTQGIIGILLLLLIQFMQVRSSIEKRMGHWPFPVRCALYCAVTLSIVLFGVDNGAQFIYFQF